MSTADYPTFEPKTLREWRRWLREHHASARGVWLASDRRGALSMRIGYAAAVEEALCYGWIDSQYRPEGERSRLLFTPRRPGSAWARSNRERVARLITEGRMHPAGLAKVAAAKRDGSWSLLEAVEALTVPPDLRRALVAANARARFAALSSSAKRAHLYALATAKREETRARRVVAIVRALPA